MSGATMLFGDPQTLHERLPMLRSITAAEVQEAAQKWLVPMVHAQARVLPEEADESPEPERKEAEA